MNKTERISYTDIKEKIITNMKLHINEMMGVIKTSERHSKLRKGKLLIVTNTTVTFEFPLGETHKEVVSYLLSDFWRGIVILDGVEYCDFIE